MAVNINENALIQLINNGVDIIKPTLSTVVGAVMTVLFLRKNTETTEFAKIKSGHFEKVIEDLYNTGKITNLEIAKCKNFLDIAKIAEKYTINNETDFDSKSENREFDFDWFLRFFEASSTITNEEMKDLWGQVLAGEINQIANFSLRTIETLRNLSANEAKLFKKIAQMVLFDSQAMSCVFATNTTDEDDYNAKYGVPVQEYQDLLDCGILSTSPINMEVQASITVFNGSLALHLAKKEDAQEPFRYRVFTLTQAGRQLLPIVDGVAKDDYLLALGKLLKRKNADNLQVSMYKIISIDEEGLDIDYETDLLSTEEEIDC